MQEPLRFGLRERSCRERCVYELMLHISEKVARVGRLKLHWYDLIFRTCASGQ